MLLYNIIPVRNRTAEEKEKNRSHGTLIDIQYSYIANETKQHSGFGLCSISLYDILCLFFVVTIIHGRGISITKGVLKRL
jgi:hypothetical protein